MAIESDADHLPFHSDGMPDHELGSWIAHNISPYRTVSLRCSQALIRLSIFVVYSLALSRCIGDEPPQTARLNESDGVGT